MIFYYPVLGELNDEMSIRTPGATVGKPEADSPCGHPKLRCSRVRDSASNNVPPGCIPVNRNSKKLVIVTKTCHPVTIRLFWSYTVTIRCNR
ncbi:MAG: hypothetical protein R3C26_25425 [Calditrichia bacterium]